MITVGDEELGDDPYDAMLTLKAQRDEARLAAATEAHLADEFRAERDSLRSQLDASEARLRRFLEGDEPYCTEHDLEAIERIEAQNAAYLAVVEAARAWVAYYRDGKGYGHQGGVTTDLFAAVDALPSTDTKGDA